MLTLMVFLTQGKSLFTFQSMCLTLTRNCSIYIDFSYFFFVYLAKFLNSFFIRQLHANLFSKLSLPFHLGMLFCLLYLLCFIFIAYSRMVRRGPRPLVLCGPSGKNFFTLLFLEQVSFCFT